MLQSHVVICNATYILSVIQDMYDGFTKSVRTLIGSTESFEVKVGLHQI